MSEPLYPPLTPNQLRILDRVKTYTRLSRKEIALYLGVQEREAIQEISSLVIRGALVADAMENDVYSLGREADFWMSSEAQKGACPNTCPSCGVNPCSKPAGHAGTCYCSSCRHND